MSWSQPEGSPPIVDSGEFPPPSWLSRHEHLSEEPGRGGATTVESPFKEPGQLQPEHQTGHQALTRLPGFASLSYRTGVPSGLAGYASGGGNGSPGGTGEGMLDREHESDRVGGSGEEAGQVGLRGQDIEVGMGAGHDHGDKPPMISPHGEIPTESTGSPTPNSARLPSPFHVYPTEPYAGPSSSIHPSQDQQLQQQQFELEAHLASIAHSLRVAEEQNAALGAQQAHDDGSMASPSAGQIHGDPSTSVENDHVRPAKVPKVKGKAVTTQKTREAGIKRRNVEARFHCPIEGCGSSFTRSHNLSGHLRSHNDERPFKCPVCQRGFARQHDCKRHARLHVPSQAQSFQCPNCDRKFARSDGLLQHQNICAFAQVPPPSNLQSSLAPPQTQSQTNYSPMDPGQPSYSNPEEGHMGENGFEARQSLDSGFDNGVLQGSSGDLGGMGEGSGLGMDMGMGMGGDREALESAVSEYIRCYPSFRPHEQSQSSANSNYRSYASPFPSDLNPPELLVWLSHSAYPDMAKDPSILRSLGKLMGLPSIADDHPALSLNSNGKRRFDQPIVDPELMKIEDLARTIKDFQAASARNDGSPFEFPSALSMGEHAGPSGSFGSADGEGEDNHLSNRSPSIASIAGSSKGETTRCNYIQPITGERCMKTFARIFDMRRHVETIHHSAASDPNRPGFVCEGCEKKFSRSDALVRHRRDYCVHRKTVSQTWDASASVVDQQLPSGAQPDAEFESPFGGPVDQSEEANVNDVVVGEHERDHGMA